MISDFGQEAFGSDSARLSAVNVDLNDDEDVAGFRDLDGNQSEFKLQYI